MEAPSYAAMAAPITAGPPKWTVCTHTNHRVLTHQVPTSTQPQTTSAPRTAGSRMVQARASRAWVAREPAPAGRSGARGRGRSPNVLRAEAA